MGHCRFNHVVTIFCEFCLLYFLGTLRPLNSQPPGPSPVVGKLPRTERRSWVTAGKALWRDGGTCCCGDTCGNIQQPELGNARLGRPVQQVGNICLGQNQPRSLAKILSQQLRWRQASGEARNLGPLSLNGREDFHLPPNPHPATTVSTTFSASLSLSHSAFLFCHQAYPVATLSPCKVVMHGLQSQTTRVQIPALLLISFGKLLHPLILHLLTYKMRSVNIIYFTSGCHRFSVTMNTSSHNPLRNSYFPVSSVCKAGARRRKFSGEETHSADYTLERNTHP